MPDCYCDYEPFRFYRDRIITARKPHPCSECRRPIHPGERYEHLRAVDADDRWEVYRTCCRCLALRDYIRAHIPCFCWGYDNFLVDAETAIDDWRDEAPGLAFGAGRLAVAIRRNHA